MGFYSQSMLCIRGCSLAATQHILSIYCHSDGGDGFFGLKVFFLISCCYTFFLLIFYIPDCTCFFCHFYCDVDTLTIK